MLPITPTFASVLRLHRERLGLSQLELAAKLKGISRIQLCQWEARDDQPKRKAPAGGTKGKKGARGRSKVVARQGPNRRPNLAKIGRLANALQLNDADREELRYLAAATFIPDEKERLAIIATFYELRERIRKEERLREWARSAQVAPRRASVPNSTRRASNS